MDTFIIILIFIDSIALIVLAYYIHQYRFNHQFKAITVFAIILTLAINTLIALNPYLT